MKSTGADGIVRGGQHSRNEVQRIRRHGMNIAWT